MVLFIISVIKEISVENNIKKVSTELPLRLL